MINILLFLSFEKSFESFPTALTTNSENQLYKYHQTQLLKSNLTMRFREGNLPFPAEWHQRRLSGIFDGITNSALNKSPGGILKFDNASPFEELKVSQE
jgi:hypothetical protein